MSSTVGLIGDSEERTMALQRSFLTKVKSGLFGQAWHKCKNHKDLDSDYITDGTRQPAAVLERMLLAIKQGTQDIAPLLKKRHFLRPRTLWQWLWRNVAAPFSRAHVVGQDEWLHAFLTLHEKHCAEQQSLKREYEVLEEENDALKEELKKMERQLKRRRTENQRLRVLAQRNS